ncbi:MAG TPA: hypothetical protein VGL38_02420 [bacterium]|jgi:TolB-like protein
MKTLFAGLALFCLTVAALAQPRVLIFPFDPIMDSLYTFDGKQSILDYRKALQEMITADLSKYPAIRVVAPSDLSDYIKVHKVTPATWNDPVLASRTSSALGADYAIIGSYGEFAHQIRVDARIGLAASTDIPPGYAVSATVNLWEDLPTAAARIAEQLVPILTAGGNLHPASTAILFPEGDLSAYNPTGSTSNMARLVVWVNAPAPQITAGSVTFARCDRIDLTGASTEKQRANACRMAVLPAGPVEIRIAHRGYLPYVQTLTLAPGKAYRLEAHLQPVELSR